MTGTRTYLCEFIHQLRAGEYAKLRDGWHARTPNGMLANLTNHEVLEHEDGTITVSPSILVTGGGTWHGWIERGVWRSE